MKTYRVLFLAYGQVNARVFFDRREAREFQAQLPVRSVCKGVKNMGSMKRRVALPWEDERTT